VNASQIETSAKYVEIALKEGAKLLTGGHALTERRLRARHVLRAHGLRRRHSAMRIAREEVFGPVVA
jgi:acyl-CoA reductase-like NAD-dependent aldehyde dehydrogenase